MVLAILVDPEPNDSNQGATYSGTVDDSQPFVLGKGVPYQGRRGLMSVTRDLLYDPDEFPKLGAWAHLLDCTAYCESKRSHTCINTYDRAAFTFGCLQFAAHVANGDFVQWFRALLGRSDAADVFPDLRLSNGRICHVNNDVLDPLESDASTSGLMSYLNSDEAKVDEAETLAATRFIYWINMEVGVRESYVEQGDVVFRKLASGHANIFQLANRPDFIVAAIIDIYHHGRGGSEPVRQQSILAALDAATVDNQLDALLAIGADKYPARCADLRYVITGKRKNGQLGAYKYDAAHGDFVRISVAPSALTMNMALAQVPTLGADLDRSAGGLTAVLAGFERHAECEAIVGVRVADANRPGSTLIVTGANEYLSIADTDIVEIEPIGGQSWRAWVKKGARAWRSTPVEIGGSPRMRETRIGMEDLAPPPMLPIAGMPTAAEPIHRQALMALAPAAQTIAGAAAEYNGSCAGGDHYDNNCAHFLSDAFIRAGFAELLPNGAANTLVTARCGTPAKRIIRARDMWHWFQSKATTTANQLTKNTGFWAVFQLNEAVYWGGHVVIVDTDTWTYYGTNSYWQWDQHAFKW